MSHLQLLLALFVVFDEIGLLEKATIDLLDLGVEGAGAGAIEGEGGAHRFELLAAALASQAVAQGDEVLHPRRIAAVNAAGLGELLLHTLQLVEQVAAGLGHAHAIGLARGSAAAACCTRSATAEVRGGETARGDVLAQLEQTNAFGLHLAQLGGHGHRFPFESAGFRFWREQVVLAAKIGEFHL